MHHIRGIGACISAAFLLAVGVSASRPAVAATPLTVTYAGSLGTVMDQAIGPAFAKAHDVEYRGIGNGSYTLARLLAARETRADLFIPITPGPIKVVQQAGLATRAVPVASTEMVIVYNPKSRFAREFEAAAAGKLAWYKVLEQPGVRFGRTDPKADPQGDNIILTFMLAERLYHEPGLARRILGPLENPAQINGETSTLTRLQEGQIDACSGYLAEAVSRHLPYIKLPDAINLGDPAKYAKEYASVHFPLTLPDGKTVQESVQPLEYYAAVLKNAAHPKAAEALVRYMLSPAGQALLHRYGYAAPTGGNI